MISRGILRLLGLEKDKPSQVEGLNLRDARRVEPFGITTKPPTGNEAFVFLVGGDWGDAVHFLTTDKEGNQPELEEGEVALYFDKDNYVAIKKDSTEIKRGEAILTIKDNKLSFKNGQGDLLSLIDELITEIATHQTPTLMGPQVSPSAVNFESLKARLKGVLA